MDIYVQWTKKRVDDAFLIDHIQWPMLVKRAEPEPGELGGLDDSPGWISSITVMGIVYHSDHYALQTIENNGILFIAWDDDEDDRGTSRIATETKFYPPKPDPALGGRINTDYIVTIYADSETLSRMTQMAERAPGEVAAMLDYSAFKEPADDMNTRHGVWCSDEKFAEHQALCTPRSWRLWIG